MTKERPDLLPRLPAGSGVNAKLRFSRYFVSAGERLLGLFREPAMRVFSQEVFHQGVGKGNGGTVLA